ncbi:hypothetical protein J2T50_002087 [Streptococcus gallinaceus]|uniref:hypothetical protein n=1 Tax=Streptococcus gallinaceus TaxID=165758 RepID=UPI0020A21EC1|nr:hypothetical protein [Streptococcus gallinaceus]MCP1640351.1 hypothetical protein [Streptococcus gallinaceus]MCP1771134.1 hypothetical protein [Streptococcus gallinaceus]
MRKGKRNLKSQIADILNLYGCFPFIISALLAGVSYKLNLINANSKGLDNLFSNIINVFAVVIGVLIALFGILPSISGSEVIKRIREYEAEKQLLYFCKETLILSFLSLFSTIVIEFFNRNYDLQKYNFIFYLWLFVVCSALISSFRTVLYLLNISLLSSKEFPEIQKMDESKSKEFKEKYFNKE